MFRDLRKQSRFAGGGGGGGGSDIILFFPVGAGQDRENYLHSRRFFDISGRLGDHPPFLVTHRSTHSKNVTTSIHCIKKHLPKVWGGGHGPRGPPGYATVCGLGLVFHNLEDPIQLVFVQQ